MNKAARYAARFAPSRSNPWMPITSFYVDGHEALFEDCSRTGRMELELNEITGNKACAVADAAGLWMSAPYRGMMSPTSNAGTKRFLLDVAIYMQRKSVEIFFADFFCKSYAPNVPHYVTLVLCPVEDKAYE